jgi:7-cyano-7-deazaguanine reductase
MSNTAHDSPLGKTVAGSQDYDPTLLFPIPRAAKRVELGLSDPLPFRGVDIWNAYELSWLDARGKPRVALGEIRVPATSPNLIESKSLKLYLNSFNQTRFDNADAVHAHFVRDLSAASGGDVVVDLRPLDHTFAAPMDVLAGELIDDLDIAIDGYGPPRPDLLGVTEDRPIIEETLVSHLLKSNCPVTGQPDWASVQIRYRGAPIDRAGLLRYLVSFRLHDDFHEQCVERIFVDIANRCEPARLAVSARYTRRGGLDINPWRSNFASDAPLNPRLVRQ